MGPASGKVSVKGYPGAMSGSADLRVASGRIGTTPYDEIVARATFSGSSVMLDSFNVKLGDGNITAAGGIEIASGAQGLPGATVKDFRVEGKNVDLNLIATLFGGGGLPALTGKTDFTATLSGNVADPTSIRADINAQGRDVTINGQPAGQLTLVGNMTKEQKFVATLTTGIFGQPQVVRATLDLAGENFPVEAETTLTGADLTPLFAALLNNPNVQVTGRATGTIRASGTLLERGRERLHHRRHLGARRVHGAERQGAGGAARRRQPARRHLHAQGGQVREDALHRPCDALAHRDRRQGGRRRGRDEQNLDVNGSLNLRLLSSASRNLFLSGTASIAVGVDGPFERPQVTGTASVQNASLALLLENERLTATQINGLVRFNSNQANLESLTGRLGGGRVSATGGALISGFVPTQFRLVARGENVTVPAAAFVTLPAFLGDLPTTADADLEIRGGSEGVFATGTVKVRRTEITEDIDLADLIDRRNEVPITSGDGGGGGGGGGLLRADDHRPDHPGPGRAGRAQQPRRHGRLAQPARAGAD